MFVQSQATSNYRHKDGLCLAQRRAGDETLVQWSNGDQRWMKSDDLEGKIILVDKTGDGGHDYE